MPLTVRKPEEKSISLINTRIQSFNTTAYHDGKFVPVSDANLKGQWSVVFFYPADFTFVCPTELGDLANHYDTFKALGVEIYAVSTDTHFAHKAWHDSSDTISKIRYPMLDDPTGVISRSFGVISESTGLALLQVGGHPSKTSIDIIEQIRQLEGEYEFETYISLSCQNCPDVAPARKQPK